MIGDEVSVVVEFRSPVFLFLSFEVLVMHYCVSGWDKDFVSLSRDGLI